MITQESIPYTADEIKAMVKTCEKYKEALEKLQEALAPTEDGCKISGLTRDCLENIFPELKKSEDERIRKEIISFLKDFEKDHYRSVNLNSWIAWLEKQGEKKELKKIEPKKVNANKVINWVNPDKVIEWLKNTIRQKAENYGVYKETSLVLPYNSIEDLINDFKEDFGL